MRHLILAFVVIQVGLTTTIRAQSRDGILFDQGVTMTAPAERAPEQLSKMLFVLGQWDVDYTEFRADTVLRSGTGMASITLMNRGHGIMERMYCTGCADSLDINTLSFLAYNSNASVWNLGEANGLAESISLHHGDFIGDDLELLNSIRRGGGPALSHYRTTYHSLSENAFEVNRELSTDFGSTWQPLVRKEYRRRESVESFLSGTSKYGSPDPEQPEEARAFDFLIGTYDAPMMFVLADGREVEIASTTTAVYAMNGQAILEFGWTDANPRLKDSGTSLIRLYNRAMQRWESIYMSNRASGALFFGGTQQGDEIVLTLFEADMDQGPIQRYVFHDISEDEYHWYGAQSFDRGRTYSKYWIIDMKRIPEE